MANKKIQVSTIEMVAAVQIIRLNSQFVAKSIRAQIALKDAMSSMSCMAEERCKPVMAFLDELVEALLDEENEAEQPAPEINEGEE